VAAREITIRWDRGWIAWILGVGAVAAGFALIGIAWAGVAPLLLVPHVFLLLEGAEDLHEVVDQPDEPVPADRRPGWARRTAVGRGPLGELAAKAVGENTARRDAARDRLPEQLVLVLRRTPATVDEELDAVKQRLAS
jgi:hypothetical protein